MKQLSCDPTKVESKVRVLPGVLMKLERFLGYLKKYNRKCPPGVAPAEWARLLRWYDARLRLGEPVVFGYKLA